MSRKTRRKKTGRAHRPTPLPHSLDALDALRLEIAPRLASLIYIGRLPDATLWALLNWAELLQGQDAARALELASLERALSQLQVAYLASHVYAIDPDSRRDAPEVLMTDRAGCAPLVLRAVAAAAQVAIALHGDDGAAAILRVAIEYADKLEAIRSAVVREASS